MTSRPDARGRTVYSCVLDDTPALWAAFVPWIATLTTLAEVAPRDIVVHHVCALRPRIAEVLGTLGVRTVESERFGAGPPFLNKVNQCWTDFEDARRVVLTDVDLVFLRPLPMKQIRQPVAGKVVDFPNPPMTVLGEVLAAAGVGDRGARITGAFVADDGTLEYFDTLPGNLNGGLYVLDREVIPQLGPAWAAKARWLVDHDLPPGRFFAHSDQVGFALAVETLGLEVQTLGPAWNLPLHCTPIRHEATAYILHHHGLLTPELTLAGRPHGWAWVDKARADRAIGDFRRTHGL